MLHSTRNQTQHPMLIVLTYNFFDTKKNPKEQIDLI